VVMRYWIISVVVAIIGMIIVLIGHSSWVARTGPINSSSAWWSYWP
jgi:hypothetical protein